MQYKTNQYKSGKHDRFKALTLKQPWPDKILTGQKTIEVRNWRTSYRGELVITSSKTPGGDRSGYTICKVDLVDIRNFSDLTVKEKYDTAIPSSKWGQYEGSWAWILKNPRPVVQLPVKGQMGIWNLVLDRGTLVEDYGGSTNETEFKPEFSWESGTHGPISKFVRNLRFMFYGTIFLMAAAVAFIIYLIVK